MKITLDDHIAHCVLITRLGRPHPNFFSRMEGGATVHRFPDWRLKIFSGNSRHVKFHEKVPSSINYLSLN